MKMPAFCLLLAALSASAESAAQRNAPADAPFILEHSYWLQPGQTSRFIDLLNKNKMPLLKRELAEGRILWMRLTTPRLRSTDTSQPDLRLTIAWRNSVVAWDDVDPSRFVSALFPDAQKWRQEELDRERLIIGRSDVPVQESVISAQ